MKITKTFKVTKVDGTTGDVSVTEASGYTQASQIANNLKKRNPTQAVLIMIELHTEDVKHETVPGPTSYHLE